MNVRVGCCEKTISSELIDFVGNYGIARTIAKKYDPTHDRLYGHAIVYYEVVDDLGRGDIVESFKTVGKAKAWAEVVV